MHIIVIYTTTMAKGLVLGDTIIALANDQKNYSRYLNEVSKYDVLTSDEETEYFAKYRAGDISYYDKIAQRNLRFVITVAKRYQNIVQYSTALTLEDLISEGNLGLCIAIQRFDPSHGFKFISFAVWYIRSKITESVHNHLRTIRQPSSRQLLMNKINKLEMELQQQYDMAEIPAQVLEEYVKEKNISLYDKLSNIRLDMNFTSSLDSVVHTEQRTGEADRTLNDLIADLSIESPQENLLSLEKKQYLNTMLSRIPNRVAKFFEYYYGLNGQPELQLNEISKLMDVHRETIRFNLKRWTRRLNRYYEQEYLTTIC